MSKPRKKTAKAFEFRLQNPHARSVAVAGSFNDWDPSRGAMKRDSNGCWQLDVMLAPGRHEYRFVVDGQWTDDPNAKEFVPNTQGSRNAVVLL